MSDRSSRRLRDRAVIVQEGKCVYCSRPFTHRRPATADHVIPRHLGGKSTVSNIVAACEPCNRAKFGRRPTPQEREAAERITQASARLVHERSHTRAPRRPHACQCEVPCASLGPQQGLGPEPSDAPYP